MKRNSERVVVGEVPPGLIGCQIFARSAEAESVVSLATYPEARAVFISGKPGPMFEWVDELQLGGHGDSVFYTGMAGEMHHVLWNEQVLGTHEWVGKLCLSSDGMAAAYPTMESYTDQKYRLRVNGVPGPEFDAVGEVLWHPKERLVAYSAEHEGSERVVLGDRLLPPYESVRGLQFSPEGNLYYWARKQGDWWLCDLNGVVDRSEGDDPPAFRDVLFGPNGKLAYWIDVRGKWFVRHGSEEYGPWPGFQRIVGALRYASGALTYVTEDQDKVRVCMNAVAGQKFDAVGRPAVDSNVLVYKARVDRKEFLVVNGARGKAYDVGWPEEGEYATYLEDVPVVSSEGAQIAFVATEGNEEMVVVNDKEHRRFKRINGQVSISPATNCLVYGAQNGRDHFVVIDSDVLGPFEEIFSAKKPTGLRFWSWCPEFVDEGKRLRFFCVEGGTILKCTVEL